MASRSEPAPAARAPSGSANRGAESTTRRKVTDAALQCILDRGLYRASSNQIARQAGVSWGVIQHHFGTREALMLSAVTDGTDRLIEGMRVGVIDGGTTAERVRQLVDVLERFYADPKFLAILQILLNFATDPDRSDVTDQAIRQMNRKVSGSFDQVMQPVVAVDPPDRELESFVFETIRGFWLGRAIEQVTGTPGVRRRSAAAHERERERLVLAMSTVIDAAAASSPARRRPPS